MKRRLVPILVLGLFACSGVSDVERQNPRPLEALAVYSTWWEEIGTCSGRSGDLSRIEWWQATSIMVNRQIVRAQWEKPHRITVVSFYADSELVVKHEMLHDLLNGDPDHSDGSWDGCDVRTPAAQVSGRSSGPANV